MKQNVFSLLELMLKSVMLSLLSFFTIPTGDGVRRNACIFWITLIRV